MCVLCSWEIMKNLNIREKVRAGMEMLDSAKTDEEFEHILEKLEEFERIEDSGLELVLNRAE